MSERYRSPMLCGAILFQLALLLAGSVPTNAQQWLNYTDTRSIQTIFKRGDDLWLGAVGALIRYRAAGDVKDYYQRANSGLPNNRITAFLNDGAAGVWIGTGGGLAHFNGAEWQVMNTGNSNIPANEITSLYRGRDGALWVGTYFNGMGRYDGTTWTNYSTVNSGLLDDNVFGFASDTAGHLWIATKGKGIVEYDGTAWTEHSDATGAIPSNYVNDILVDSAGSIWAATAKGVSVYNGSTWWTYDRTNSALPSNDIQAITLDPAGHVWAATSESGIAKFDGTNWTAYTPSTEAIPEGSAHDLLITEDGTVWLATSKGVARRQGGTWTSVNTATTPFVTNAVTSAVGDAAGTLWVGSTYFGAAAYDGTEWKQYTNETGELPSTSVRGLATDRNGLAYICTGAGIAIFDKGSWNVYDASNSAITGPVNCAAADGKGIIWAGTQGGGVKQYRNSGWYTHTQLEQGLPANDITCVVLDKQDQPWIGTRSGIAVYSGTTWTTYTHAGGALPDDGVQAMMVDTDGTVYVGTENGGLGVRAPGGTWSTIDSAGGLPSNNITSIARDKHGDLWLGTRGRGLVKKLKDGWYAYTSMNSKLPENSIVSLAVDRNGNLIVGLVDGGVALFNEWGLSSGVDPLPRLPLRSVSCSVAPNPVARTATFTLDLAAAGRLTVEIVGLDGRLVARPLREEMLPSGVRTVACDLSGIPSGEYIYSVRTDAGVISGKIVIAR